MYDYVNKMNAHSAATPNFVSTDEATGNFGGYKGIENNTLAASASAIKGGKRRRLRSKKHGRRSRKTGSRRGHRGGSCGSCGVSNYLGLGKGGSRRRRKSGGSHKRNKKCNCLCHMKKNCRRSNCKCACHKLQHGGITSITNPISGYSIPGYSIKASELALANPPPVSQYQNT